MGLAEARAMIERDDESGGFPTAPEWMNPLQSMRWDLYQRGPALDFRASHESLAIDETTIRARCGLIWTQRLQFFPGRRFDLVDDEGEGEPAVFIECFGADAWTRVDCCAWPVGRPADFALAFGFADLLGVDQIRNPASYFGGRPLPIFRTPETWLRAGGEGCVILNELTAPASWRARSARSSQKT
jgi:hypothetical protein